MMRQWIDLFESIELPWGHGQAGCWITDESEVLACDYEGDHHHGDLVADQGGFDDLEDELDDLVDIGQKKGWVRIRMDQTGFNVSFNAHEVSRKALRKVPQAVDGQREFYCDIWDGEKIVPIHANSIGRLMGMIRDYLLGMRATVSDIQLEGVDHQQQLAAGYETYRDMATDNAYDFGDGYDAPDLSYEAYMGTAKYFLEEVLGQPLYRGMRVRQIDLENAQHLGVFYSEQRDHSESFSHGSSNYDERFDHIEYSPDQTGVIIEIEPITNPDSIDLPVTLALNIHGGEGEVRLLRGEPIVIKCITDTMGRGIWQHLWGETYRA